MLVNLLNNIAFLIALAAAGQLVVSRFHNKGPHRQIILGLLFGGVALLGMVNPVTFSPGLIFDGRSIVLAVAGVVGGGVTAAIAATIAALYRYQLGGLGATVGVGVVLMSALLGVLARQWWVRRKRPPRLIDYLALGVVVQLAQLSLFTQLPDRAGHAFIEQAGWVLLLFYPLATMLLCMMFRNYEQQLIDKEAFDRAQRAHRDQLERAAHFDPLTGLPNRALLADRLHQAMAQAQRHHKLLAVAYMDLDGFKAINDRYGHHAGDHLLIALSNHMKTGLREGDTLARLGGDEFVAVLLDLPDVESAGPLLSRLLEAAAEVVRENENALRVTASMGVAFYPQATEVDADQLLRQADQAMYQAKLTGKNRYYIFDTDQDRSLRDHHESLAQIRQALQTQAFELHYQPKVNMRSGEVTGVEALIRWQHPERGLLPARAFLAQITDHPLAIEVGDWVLETAMTQIETWKAAGLSLPISVNIDAAQLAQADFVARLQQKMRAHPTVEASDLELEVLESSALEAIGQASSLILACRELGLGFALDDFGTGYSSLTYLKQLPVSMLKIDQSFVRDMLDEPDVMAILNGIIGLASAFRSRTIAEGVETLEHGELLLKLGCELAQGHAIAHPMPAADIPGWLTNWHPPPSWLNQAPISRDDLSILFAWVEHRAWIMKAASFIRNERETPPPLHPEQCRVGQWLKAERQTPTRDVRDIESVDPVHLEIHELANELIRLKQNGEAEQAVARVPELFRLRDRLLAQFIAMLR